MSDLTGLFKFATNTETVTAGTVVFRQGEIDDYMYIVKNGELEIHVNDAVVEIASTGIVIGEMGLIDHSPHSATVIAKTDAELIRISQERFLFMVQETPNFALQVMHIMAERLRRNTQRA